MTAVAVVAVERYPELGDDDRAERIRAEVHLIARFKRGHRTHADYACPACAAGTVSVERTADGKTAGACSRPNCISWEE